MDLFKDNLKQHYSRRRLAGPGKTHSRFSYSRSGRLRKLNRRNIAWAITGTIAGAAALALLAVFVVIPMLGKTSVTASASPTPTPVEKHPADMSALQKEMVLMREKHISVPSLFGKELIYSEGTDAVGGLRLANVNIYNTETDDATAVKDIKLVNDNILELHFNDSWIVWFDSKKSGGGAIYAYDRDKKEFPEIIKIKTCYFSMPRLNLYQDYVVWMDQTGSSMDKLFVYDLLSGESTTLEFYEKTPYGGSAAYVYKGKILWAGPNPKAKANVETSLIYSITLGTSQANTAPQTYDPGTYVNDPMTNGVVTAWSDGNKSPAASLYYCLRNGTPVKLADNITQYGVGTNFIAYTKEEALWLFFYDEQKHCRLTLQDEKAMLGDVLGDKVVWFDVTDETYERNVLKYAIIN
ncbi:MAG: hypothetical protein Q8O09_04330 [Bacillota bacterium]|nr:hypothetical protein [Bacillota bacterium]